MIHLHHHDSFSALDGVGSPRHCARVVANFGQPALAQTNHGTIGGLLAHRKACEEYGVIPIAGVEAYWRPNRLTRDKEWRYRRWHLILLAKNLVGWHNLIKLTSEAYASGMYQSPCVDFDLLAQHSEGIICTTSCILGPLAYLVQNGTDTQVNDWMNVAKSIFGDDLYVSIMPHDFDAQRAYNLAAVSVAHQHGCAIVHEKDSHYPEAGWVGTQKIAVLTGMNKTFADAEAENVKRLAAGDEVYELWHDGVNISTEAEDRALYAVDHPNLPVSVVDEAMRSTDDVLAKIEPYLMDRTLKMPRVKTEMDDPKAQVLKWCRQGLREMGRDGDPVYEQRLEYEADVIDGVEAWSYFAMVADVVRWARSDEPLPSTPEDPDPPRKRPIRINSGRGSAAASLVCRASKITMVDPIAHRFKFERFLNPGRKSMPDIDLDVASLPNGDQPGGRALIKEYVARRYGRNSIADVVAYQHFQPRAALKACAHAMYGFDSEAFKRISVLTHENTGVIDPVHDVDLEKLRERERELQTWAVDFPECWEHARRLENAGDPSVLRISKHAAAVVVLPGDVTDVMPTLRADDEDQTPRTAWAETTRISVVEEMGVLKIDFLGLIGMDRQQRILDMVERHTGQMVDLDALPALSDPYAVEQDVMEIFRRGLTLGMNQMGSDGIRAFTKRVVPQNIVDLAAINAIYRPGPLGSGAHNRFVKRRRGEDVPDYPPILREILDETFGVIAFQEQVMELFERLVGYTPGQADDVRKIIAKLYRDKTGGAVEALAELEAIFVPAATEKIGLESAQSIWQEILPYSGYSFNRPHASSYMIQSYQDAWFKTHYPLFSYSVYLTLDEKKAMAYLREARDPLFALSVLPPDVNISEGGFTPDVEANAIRFGLGGIKGIGAAVADQILADRPFSSLDDFITRSSRKYSKVNKRAREILINVGALDRFGLRADGTLAWTDQQTGEDVYWDAKLRANQEMELIGVALEPSGVLGQDAVLVQEHVNTEQEVAASAPGTEVVVAGKIVECRRTRVKRGRQEGRAMATGIKIVLGMDHYVCVAFPDVWDQFESLLGGDGMVIVRGKVDDRGVVKVEGAMDLEKFIDERRDILDAQPERETADAG